MELVAVFGIVVGVTSGLCGSVLGIANFLRDRNRRKQDDEDRRSQFHLDACLTAYEAARKLLADGNNDRAAWIQAGRALRHAQALSKAITTDHHRRVLELHQIDYRGSFYRALQHPPPFFYGAKVTSTSIEAAAKESTAPERRLDRVVSSTLKELSPRSLHAVWEAAQWPQDYEDPLDAEFSETDLGKLIVLFPGLYEFLDHRTRSHSGSGKLFRDETGE